MIENKICTVMDGLKLTHWQLWQRCRREVDGGPLRDSGPWLCAVQRRVGLYLLDQQLLFLQPDGESLNGIVVHNGV